MTSLRDRLEQLYGDGIGWPCLGNGELWPTDDPHDPRGASHRVHVHHHHHHERNVMTPQDFYEKVVAEAARRTVNAKPDAEPTAEELVAAAIGPRRGHKVRNGNTFEIVEEQK